MKWRGAKVIGTTSRNFEFLRELNVDQIIDYSSVPFEEEARDVDVVLDIVAGEVQRRSCMVLKPNGILVSVIQEPAEELTAEFGVRSAMVYSAPPIGEVLTEIAKLVDTGLIKPHVSAVLPIQEAPKAHEMVEGRHTCGKIVLQVAQ